MLERMDPLNISVIYGDALALETPLLAFGAWEDEPLPQQIAGLLEDGDWAGTFKQTLVLYPRGAAAVLGTMQAVADLKLPLHVVGLVASAENMPSSTASRPGDIITTLSGKTVEVLNTDAEGRIVLADALYYAQHYQPDALIDLATLTGAIVVALGQHATGLMSNDDTLGERVLAAGAATGEPAWRMPLWDPYKEMVKSQVADVRNTGGSRYGGAITGAAFLANFVGDYPWVHLDIAGTAYAEQTPKKSYTPRGAIGVGVRLLTYLLRMWSEARQ